MPEYSYKLNYSYNLNCEENFTTNVKETKLWLWRHSLFINAVALHLIGW